VPVLALVLDQEPLVLLVGLAAVLVLSLVAQAVVRV
jgi:hypothetical protein